MRSGIVFDCDGTLVDSLSAALESFNFALVKVGVGKRTAEQIKKFFGASADRILLSLIGDKKLAEEAFEIYLDHQSELAKRTHLHAGVADMLTELHKMNVPMGIVTGRHQRDLRLLLEPHKIQNYFETMIADSDLQRSKPEPDGILLAGERMQLDLRTSYYVGDSHTDILAAKAAGCLSIAALWDRLAKREDMRAAGADLFAETPADVVRIFAAI